VRYVELRPREYTARTAVPLALFEGDRGPARL
jgi:hypothetical protein